MTGGTELADHGPDGNLCLHETACHYFLIWPIERLPLSGTWPMPCSWTCVSSISSTSWVINVQRIWLPCHELTPGPSKRDSPSVPSQLDCFWPSILQTGTSFISRPTYLEELLLLENHLLDYSFTELSTGSVRDQVTLTASDDDYRVSQSSHFAFMASSLSCASPRIHPRFLRICCIATDYCISLHSVFN